MNKKSYSQVQRYTIFRCVQPLVVGNGDIAIPQLEEIEEQLTLLGGDLSLLALEEVFAKAWYSTSDEHSVQILSAFWQVLQQAGLNQAADIILIDLGSNLGAINRTALIAADYVIVPVAPELLSVQGLEHSGMTLQKWRNAWQQKLTHNSVAGLNLPQGKLQPIGYVIFQPPIRLDHGTNMYAKWTMQIPTSYHQTMFNETEENVPFLKDDPHFLILFKGHYSVIPMAQEARKPIFHLKPADGALGAHLKIVQSAYVEFQQLARKIAKRVGVRCTD